MVIKFTTSGDVNSIIQQVTFLWSQNHFTFIISVLIAFSYKATWSSSTENINSGFLIRVDHEGGDSLWIIFFEVKIICF
jgi:hypothetical protein